MDWKLEYLNGNVYKDGSFKLDIPNGGITDLGRISIPLTEICQAAKMVLKMEIRNTSFSNNCYMGLPRQATRNIRKK